MDMMRLLFYLVITVIVLWTVIFFIALMATINSEGEEKTSDDIVEFTKAILTAIKVLGFFDTFNNGVHIDSLPSYDIIY